MNKAPTFCVGVVRDMGSSPLAQSSEFCAIMASAQVEIIGMAGMKLMKISVVIMLMLLLTACDGLRGPQDHAGEQESKGDSGSGGSRVIIGRVFYSYAAGGEVVGCQPFGSGSCGADGNTPDCTSGNKADEMTMSRESNRVLLCIK
jgi:hypothetical protein